MSRYPDQTLAALAFVEAVIDGNTANWGLMLDTTCRDDLLVGLTALTKSLLEHLAAATDRTLPATVEMERAVHLFTAGAA